MDDKPIGERIRAARTAADITQEELAATLKICQSSISRWERGLREPSGSRVKAAAKAIGIDEQTLRFGSLDEAANRAAG